MNFLITLNQDGTIGSCEAVEGKKRGMFYVRANSKEEACAIFAARYRRGLRVAIESAKKRRAANRERGLCLCGKPLVPGSRKCALCNTKKANVRSARKQAGLCLSCPKAAAIGPRGGSSYCEDHAKRQSDLKLSRKLGIKTERKVRISSQDVDAMRYLRHREQSRKSAKCDSAYYVLRNVLRQYRELTPERFEGWLVVQLNAAQDAKLARRTQRPPQV